MDAAAEDDTERARNRAMLYAPPAGWKKPGRRMGPPGMGMNRAQAEAMMAQVAAQDAQFAAGATG